MNDVVWSLAALLGIFLTAWLGLHLLYETCVHQYGLRAEDWTPRQRRTASHAVLTLVAGFVGAVGAVLVALLGRVAG